MIESERKAVASPVEKAILSSGVTPRALLIGTALSVLLAFLSICQEALGGGLSADGYGSGALFLLFALILCVGLLKRIKAVRSGPSPQELLVVFSMLLMVSAIPINGTLMYLIPNMVGFAHYATPENDWGSQVLPLLPDGLSIKDPGVAKGFFEGLGPDGKPPYGAWIWPFFAWAVLLGAFYFTMISLMVIFRKRWIEEERLPFPMAQVPLALVEGDAGGRPLLRNTAFWAGFFLSGVERLSSIVHLFIPAIRPINLRFYSYTRTIQVFGFTNFIAIGISYLVSLEVLGSILLFTLITYVQMYLLTLYSVPRLVTPPKRPRVIYGVLHQEALGALVVLVGVMLYEARHHLRDVFRKAFGLDPEVDDWDEMLSYRTAVIGSIVCIVFIGFWLWMTGISIWVIPPFLVLMLAIFLGVTRILAESGAVMQAPMSPMQVILHLVGTQALGNSTKAGFFLAQSWAFPDGAHYGLPNGPHAMASASTALKLTYQKGVRSRPLFYACFLALLVGGVTDVASFLYYAYSLGGYGFANSGFVTKTVFSHLSYYGGAITDPSEGKPVRLIWTSIGILSMGLLILARKRFFWWPIHPVGYPIGTIYLSYWFNVFIAWLIKRNVLKYGGPSLYGRSRPFFFGLIFGQAVISSAGSIIAMLAGRAWP